MADTVKLSVGENTPEQVAYLLMRDIASVEGVAIHGSDTKLKRADRAWIISTYRECIRVVQGS